MTAGCVPESSIPDTVPLLKNHSSTNNGQIDRVIPNFFCRLLLDLPFESDLATLESDCIFFVDRVDPKNPIRFENHSDASSL